MSRRAWWLVVLNLLMPGSAQVLAGNRRLGRFGLGATLVFWAISILPAVSGAGGPTRADLAPHEHHGALACRRRARVLRGAVGGAHPRHPAPGEAGPGRTDGTDRRRRRCRHRPSWRRRESPPYGAASSTAAIGLLDSVFKGAQASVAPIDGRYNILLLGGDAGPDRQGLRPDSLSVASIDATTGAVTLFAACPAISRSVAFVKGSPMWKLYPHGFSCGSHCLIDYLYTYGGEHGSLYPDAKAKGSSAGIEAMRDSVSWVLGLPASVLRAHRHAGVLRSHQRARRDHGRRARDHRRRGEHLRRWDPSAAGLPHHEGRAEDERLHRPLVRQVSLRVQRLLPDGASASHPGSDHRPGQSGKRAHPISSRSRRRGSRWCRPTSRSRC